jgi:predicted GNAT family acetyltransferase
LKFIHVSSRHRKKGVSKFLFKTTVEKARRMKAQQLDILATPSENTVNFLHGVGLPAGLGY